MRLFFFQAEDGIRDHCVTGVQTCALPIFCHGLSGRRLALPHDLQLRGSLPEGHQYHMAHFPGEEAFSKRSEEHTSELQSHSDLVCRLLLEKKKIQKNISNR